MATDPQRRVELAELALSDGRAAAALAILERAPPDHGPRWQVEAEARLQLGDLDGADEALRRADELLPDDDVELVWTEGNLRLAQWRLEEARDAFERIDDEFAEPRVLERLALLADLGGDHAAADALLAEAENLDPDGHPRPPRVTCQEFERQVAAAASELPPEFQAELESVAVVVRPMPSGPMEHHPGLLGLFLGPPIRERSSLASGHLPPTIHLYQRNIERVARDLAELHDEIRVTLYHELGHALGFDEDGVADLGLA